MTKEILVADIGGTNARFAIAKLDNSNHIQLDAIEVYCTEEWSTMEKAIKDYLSKKNARPKHASIAFPASVAHDEVIMTNGNWKFKQSEIASNLCMEEVKILNDFSAQAYALPILKQENLFKIGTGEITQNRNKVVMGPGTGFGVGALISVGGKWKGIACEGGHVGFAPSGDVEKEIYSYLSKNYTRMTVENILQGAGISQIYNALSVIKDLERPVLNTEEVSLKAIQEEDEGCVEALKIYSGMIGRVASDMAGLFDALGGVYLTGGVLPKIKDVFVASKFRNKFEENEDLPFVKGIPTYLVEEEFAALYGAAGYYSGMFL